MRLGQQPGTAAKRLHADHAVLVAALALFAALGLVIAPDYGSGIDSLRNSNVGWNALQSSWSPARYSAYMENGEVLAHHGPAYFMVFSATSRLLQRLMPGWVAADGRSFTNYLTFLLAVAGLYLILLRVVPRRAALAGMLLLVTQPLLFGHGFINQKDTPFMGFFTLSVVLGMCAADRYHRESAAGEDIAGAGIREEWRAIPGWKRGLLLAALGAGLLVVLDVLVTERMLRGVQIWAEAGLSGAAGTPWQAVFDAFFAGARVESAGEVMLRLHLAYWVGRAFLLAAVLAACLGAVSRVLPRSFGRMASGHRLSTWLACGAGALVGFTISIRVIGAFAGGLILLYWVSRNRGKGLAILLLSGLPAILVSYLTWPYLWDQPWHRLVTSLDMTADFQTKETLFRGSMVASDALPWDYFPTLAAIETTEVFIPLFAAGAAVAVVRARRARLDRGVLAVLLAWLLVPLFALWFLGMGIYNNIKHLHFVLIPMAALAAVALEAIFRRITRAWWRTAVLAALLLPGIVGILRLHPYEYTYFNSFVGGVRGANGAYTLDRFCTASRAAMEYVNREAGKGALIAAPGAPYATSEFARRDLHVSGQYGEVVGGAKYVVTCSFAVGSMHANADWERVYAAMRQGVVYAEVWKRIAAP